MSSAMINTLQMCTISYDKMKSYADKTPEILYTFV